MANKNLKSDAQSINQSINQSNLEPNHLHAAVPGLHFTTKWWKKFDLKSGEMVVVNFCLFPANVNGKVVWLLHGERLDGCEGHWIKPRGSAHSSGTLFCH